MVRRMGWIALAAGFYVLGLIPPWAGDTLAERLRLRSVPAVVMVGIGVFGLGAGIVVFGYLIVGYGWEIIQWFTA